MVDETSNLIRLLVLASSIVCHYENRWQNVPNHRVDGLPVDHLEKIGFPIDRPLRL